jgi:hypothetical protein
VLEGELHWRPGEVRPVPDPSALGHAGRPGGTITKSVREGFQLSADGDWLAEYPDPSSYIPQFFGCGGGTSNGYFCDPALDTAMRYASQVGLTDPARAGSRLPGAPSTATSPTPPPGCRPSPCGSSN